MPTQILENAGQSLQMVRNAGISLILFLSFLLFAAAAMLDCCLLKGQTTAELVGDTTEIVELKKTEAEETQKRKFGFGALLSCVLLLCFRLACWCQKKQSTHPRPSRLSKGQALSPTSHLQTPRSKA